MTSPCRAAEQGELTGRILAAGVPVGEAPVGVASGPAVTTGADGTFRFPALAAALSGGRVPYSQGYAELNYRSVRGAFARLGLTYFGPNNAFDRPAFGVVSASVRVALSQASWLQLSGDNLSGAYSAPYADFFGGVPVPLQNGQLGATAGINVGPPTVRFSYHYGR